MLGHVTTPPSTPATPDTPHDPASAAQEPVVPTPPGAAPHEPAAAASLGAAPAVAPAAQPPYPAAGYPAHAGAAAPRPKNTIGLIALIVAIATLVLSTVTLIIQAAMMLQRDAGYQLINAMTTVFTSIGALLALAAVVLGAIGLTRKGLPKGAAGVGLGIGVATVWSILGSLIFNGIVSLLY